MLSPTAQLQRSGLRLLAASLLFVIASPGCLPEPGRRPNVLVVVFDTTRADDWPAASGAESWTPNLDRLAALGHRFTDARSLYSVTVPSHVSLFTGHAARPTDSEAAASAPPRLADERYDDRTSSLFTVLGRRGYRTYAFSGNDNLRPDRVAALAGVDVFSEDREARGAREVADEILGHYGEDAPLSNLRSSADWYARKRARKIVAHDAAWVNAQALEAMATHAESYASQPYLLFVNYNDAHDPYFPEPPWDERAGPAADGDFNGALWNPRRRRAQTGLRGLALSMSSAGLALEDIERARALHRAELAYADHAFGELWQALAELGLMEDTVVVVVADHGEAFGEGGRMAHGGELVPEVEAALLHVPMVVWLPEADLGPGTIDARVDLRDVKPTLLAYLGVPDESSTGRNLLPLIRGEQSELAPPAPRPQDYAPDLVGDNRIGGQDPAAKRRLEAELEALGYLEPEGAEGRGP